MKFYFAFFSAFLFLFAIGCKNPVTPQGSVSGTVKLFDGNGNPLPSDGVLVSLSGSSVTATAQTNSDGFWTMNGIPSLPSNFIYTKQGFGSMKSFNFQTTGKDTVDEVNMDKPSTEIINFQSFKMATSNGASEPTYYIQGEDQNPGFRTDSFALVLCVSTDSSSLIKDPASATVLLPFSVLASGYDGSFIWNSTSSLSLITYPFSSGTKVYAVLCIAGIGKYDFHFAGLNSSNYYDPKMSRQVFTGLSNYSQVLSGIIP